MWDFLHDVGRIAKSLGLNESTTTIGLLGNGARLILQGGWINGIISALVGAIAATYLATPIALSPTFNAWNWSEGTIGFLVGMGAMLGGEWFLNNLKSRLESIRTTREKP
ncbi:MAG: hypothetical protein IPM06_22555 [Rhizobiales bacterium]|nr:hypothetical protein [Hyphomicrobiales bacterium]